MAVIDRTQLLTDTKIYLPDANILSDPEISNLIDIVVDAQIPEDDDQYYGEALCKTLRLCGVVNKSKWVADEQGKRREKVGEVEVEHFESTSGDPWGDFLKSLNTLCPLVFGYTPDFGSVIGIKINSGDKPDPLKNCKISSSDIYL